MNAILFATALTALTIGFGIFTAIELDSYEKKNHKPHRLDVPLMLLACFSPFFTFIGTIYLWASVS